MGRRRRTLTGVLAALAAACVALVLLSGYGRWAAGPGVGPGPEGQAPTMSSEPDGPYLRCILKSLTQRRDDIVARVRFVPSGGLGAVKTNELRLGVAIRDCRLRVPGLCTVELETKKSTFGSPVRRPLVIPPEGLQINLLLLNSFETPVCGPGGAPLPASCQLEYDLDARSDWIGDDGKVVFGGKVWGVGRVQYRREPLFVPDLTPRR